VSSEVRNGQRAPIKLRPCARVAWNSQSKGTQLRVETWHQWVQSCWLCPRLSRAHQGGGEHARRGVEHRRLGGVSVEEVVAADASKQRQLVAADQAEGHALRWRQGHPTLSLSLLEARERRIFFKAPPKELLLTMVVRTTSLDAATGSQACVQCSAVHCLHWCIATDPPVPRRVVKR
jgi:hypothetical protein